MLLFHQFNLKIFGDYMDYRFKRNRKEKATTIPTMSLNFIKYLAGIEDDFYPSGLRHEIIKNV